MNKPKSLLILSGRLVLAVIFIYAAVPKLLDPNSFAAAIGNYRVFSGVIVLWAALFIPMLELLVGLGLIFNVWLRAQLYLSAGLYLVFDILIVQAFLRGLDIDCGCFGVGAQQGVTLLKLAENSILTAIAFLTLFLVIKKQNEEPDHK